MKIQDIKLGVFYRYKNNSYCYAKPLEILKAKQYPNTNNYTVVKCEWVINQNDVCGLIKYFRPKDLEKCEKTSL